MKLDCYNVPVWVFGGAAVFVLGILILGIAIGAVHGSGFKLYVNLYDAKEDSGRVKVTVQTATTTKTNSLDIGRIVKATGDSTIEKLIFGFSDRDLPPNGAFKVCANGQNCEQADRHGSVSSAIIWVQVP